jgi:hypothetical protein
MDHPELESVVSIIDHRLTVVEQILPTLATKEDLRAAVAPLPTREEMYQAIHSVVRQEGEQTRRHLHAEMHQAIREEGEQTRRHFDVVAESLRGDIRLIAEGHVTLQQSVDGLRTELKGDIAKLDRRVTRLEAARK